MESLKLSDMDEKKNLKKAKRKENKMMNVCCKQLNIQVSFVPSKWVIVWGVGLSFGSSKSSIGDIFKTEIEEIRMYSNKSITCIRFHQVDDAIAAKTQWSGMELTEGQPLYIGYLENEPPLEDTETVSSFLRECPEGLQLIRDFISAEEENAIVKEILPKEFSDSGTGLKHRWVYHYGYEFRYGSNDVDVNDPLKEPMPESISKIISKMTQQKIVEESPQQVTVNHYLPGQGIPPHVDTHSAFENPIISLSLLSPTVMDFRRGQDRFSVILPPRSLLVMKDSSRYDWIHGIANRTFDVIFDKNHNGFDILSRAVRLSLTFRILRPSRICSCPYPRLCDSQQGKISPANAPQLENTLVHKVYEEIANHFSETRHTPWPKIKEFVTNLEPGSVILDVGCGNGKYFGINTNIFQIGTDMSTGLLKLCKTKHERSDAVRANALILPFKDSCVDVVICIAMLHHLSTKERRLAALEEIMRILRNHGRALIYVWAKDQKQADSTSCYGTKQEKRKMLQDNLSGTDDTSHSDWSFLPVYNYEVDFSNNDLLVPWVNNQNKEESSVFHRYYHVFTKGELENLISDLDPSPTIIDSYYDQGNWCVCFEKLH